MLALFFEFVVSRYQGDIHALTGVVVEQPIDEFNRQSGHFVGQGPRATLGRRGRGGVVTGWRRSVPEARKYLPAARDYFAASLWRRLGLRSTGR